MLKTLCLTVALLTTAMALLPFASKVALGQGCYMQTANGRIIDLSSLCKGRGYSFPVYSLQKVTSHNYRNQWGLGLDLPAYCKQRYGSAASLNLQQNNALGWKCSVGSKTHEVSFEEACSLQYGRHARPGLGDFDDIGSWHCRLQKADVRYPASGS